MAERGSGFPLNFSKLPAVPASAACVGLTLLAGAGLHVDAAVGQNTVTTASGVFSEAQSRRGELTYLRICRECHERNLMGGGYDDIPPLKGEAFLANWGTWTVGDLFDYMQNEMPPKRKKRAGITPAEYADILAYVLEQNGFPKGDIELPPDFEPLSLIDIELSD